MTEKSYVAHMRIEAIYLKPADTAGEALARHREKAHLGDLAYRLARALERRIQADPEKFLAMIEESNV